MLNRSMRTLNMDTILKLSSVLILLTMVNFSLGSTRYFIAIPLLLILWMFFFMKHRTLVKRNILIRFFLFSFLVLLLGLPSLFDVFPHKSNFEYTYFDYSFGLLFKIFCVYSVISCLDCDKHKLVKVLESLILINISFFYVQLFVVYSTSFYIDPLEFITGERQRYLSNFSLPVIGQIYRPTGFYEEPSTYSSIILILIACKLYVDKKVDRLVAFSIFSIILSFSVASMIYGSVLSLYLLVRSKGSYSKYLFYILLPFLLYALFILGESRLNAVSGAVDIRGNLLEHTFTQSVPEVMFGNGMLGVMSSLAEYMKLGNLWGAQVAALNDNGLWLFFVIKIGVIGLILTSLAFFIRVKTRFNRFLFLLILLTKVSMFYFVFILYVGICFFINQRELNDQENT